MENHKEEVPFAHYQALFAAADAQEITKRTGLALENGGFCVRLLGRNYFLSHPNYTADETLPLPLQTFLLRYLLEGKPTPNAQDFLTFREMPWGELYIQPFTGRVLTRAAFTFGTRLDKFRAAAEKLGGLPLSRGDAGFEFDFLGNYRLRLLIWEGDDEFPPNAQLLYSANFAEGFAAEDRVVAGDLLINALKANL